MKTSVYILCLIAGLLLGTFVISQHRAIAGEKIITAKADSTCPYIFVVGRESDLTGYDMIASDGFCEKETVDKLDLYFIDREKITAYIEKKYTREFHLQNHEKDII